MSEENQESVSGIEETDSDLIDTIKALKENTVERSKYEKLQAEKKQLLDIVVNGTHVEQEKPKKDVQACREKVFNKEDQNNLEYWTNVLDLRDALIENGEPDPFLPYGHKILPTAQDIECADRVASVVRKCIDLADGDSEFFTNELQRRTVDISIPTRKYK